MEIWVSASSVQGFIEFIEPVQILHLKRKGKKKKKTLRIEPWKSLEPEEKLTIEICNFDAIHVNDFQIPKTRQR